MTDRFLFRLLGAATLVAACLCAGTAGWGIAHNAASVFLTFGALSTLCALVCILLFSVKGGDDGVD